jgi:hypothetical protein
VYNVPQSTGLSNIWDDNTLIGRVVITAGDFCQTIHVVARDKMVDDLNACPKKFNFIEACTKTETYKYRNTWVKLHSEISAGVICTKFTHSW